MHPGSGDPSGVRTVLGARQLPTGTLISQLAASFKPLTRDAYRGDRHLGNMTESGFLLKNRTLSVETERGIGEVVPRSPRWIVAASGPTGQPRPDTRHFTMPAHRGSISHALGLLHPS